ncbi:hypothetical protein [Mariniflexile sp.]|uniref:hypothetical protein n=1 Tax=Mariniflexile sp. TaxID=1979402 RepID=UPI003566AECF
MNKFLLQLLLIVPFFGFTQEHSNATTNHHNELKKVKISFAFAQAYIPSHHLHEESESAQLIPTNGLDIQYNFNHKFFAKWTNELEFLTYNLKNEDGEERIRENAFLSTVTLGYEFYDKFAIIAGVGYEFEKSKDLFVTRVGLEYSFNIGGNWELSPELLYDIKEDSHTAVTWGLAIGCRI